MVANPETMAMFGKAARVKPEPLRPKLLSFKSLDPSDVYSPLPQQTNNQMLPEEQTNNSVLHTPWSIDQRTGGRMLMKKTFSLANLLHINRYQISKPVTNISSSSTSSSTFSSLKKLLGKPWWRSSRLKGTKSEMNVRRLVPFLFHLNLCQMKLISIMGLQGSGPKWDLGMFLWMRLTGP